MAAVAVPSSATAGNASAADPAAGTSEGRLDVRWVAQQFVNKYYLVLEKHSKFFNKFYKDNSNFTLLDSSVEPTKVEFADTAEKIQERINETIASSPTKVLHFEAQYSLQDSILLQVTGQIICKGKHRCFVQSFFLAPQEKGYYVLNDIFCILPPLDMSHFAQRGFDSPAANGFVPSTPVDAAALLSEVIGPDQAKQSNGAQRITDVPPTSQRNSAPPAVATYGMAHAASFTVEPLPIMPVTAALVHSTDTIHAPPIEAVLPDNNNYAYTDQSSVSLATGTPPYAAEQQNVGSQSANPMPELGVPDGLPAAGYLQAQPASQSGYQQSVPLSYKDAALAKLKAAAAANQSSKPPTPTPAATQASAIQGTPSVELVQDAEGGAGPVADRNAETNDEVIGIFLKNLPDEATEEDLRNEFEQDGPIKKVTIVSGKGLSKFAYVDFVDKDCVARARAREATICGRKIFVREKIPKIISTGSTRGRGEDRGGYNRRGSFRGRGFEGGRTRAPRAEGERAERVDSGDERGKGRGRGRGRGREGLREGGRDGGRVPQSNLS